MNVGQGLVGYSEISFSPSTLKVGPYPACGVRVTSFSFSQVAVNCYLEDDGEIWI